jgi:hypothetical protein
MSSGTHQRSEPIRSVSRLMSVALEEAEGLERAVVVAVEQLGQREPLVGAGERSVVRVLEQQRARVELRPSRLQHR